MPPPYTQPFPQYYGSRPGTIGPYFAQGLMGAAGQIADALAHGGEREHKRKMDEASLALRRQQLGQGAAGLQHKRDLLDYYNRNLEARQGMHTESMAAQEASRLAAARRLIAGLVGNLGGQSAPEEAASVLAGGGFTLDPSARARERYRFKGSEAAAKEAGRQGQVTAGEQKRALMELRGREAAEERESHVPAPGHLGPQPLPLSATLPPNAIAPARPTGLPQELWSRRTAETQGFRAYQSALGRISRARSAGVRPSGIDVDEIIRFHEAQEGTQLMPEERAMLLEKLGVEE